jgi:N-acetylmuramoyl-L-alanine amidase
MADIFGTDCPPDPSPPQIPAYPGLVKRGDSGAAVRAWQTQLTALPGYALKVDGVFGEETEAHVIWFQASHGLRVDGIAGPETWHWLMDARGFI